MNRTLKHFVKMVKAYTARRFCVHEDSQKSSCPFTGRTYVICTKCGIKISEEITKND